MIHRPTTIITNRSSQENWSQFGKLFKQRLSIWTHTEREHVQKQPLGYKVPNRAVRSRGIVEENSKRLIDLAMGESVGTQVPDVVIDDNQVIDNAHVITSEHVYEVSNTRRELLKLMDFDECMRVLDKPLNLQTHSKMYVIADKYQILGLKELSLQKLTTNPHTYCSTEDFQEAAKLVYENTPETDLEIRHLIAGMAQRELEKKGMTEGIRTFLISVPELAVYIVATKYPTK